jgi:hypothetical protein
MEETNSFLKTHQQKLALTAGYVLIGVAAFGLGRLTTPVTAAPEIKVEEAFAPTTNYTPIVAGNSSGTNAKCEGQIKGSTGMIYHLPGGAFYDRTTNPAKCFDTEAEAQAAGFRKSSR